jgi:hypothetical protein
MALLLPESDDENTPSSSSTAASVKGICNVVYSPGNVLKANASLSKVMEASTKGQSLLVASLPFRFASFHFCYDDPAMALLLRALKKGIDKRVRIRLRTHYGTPIEIRYCLLTFGIHCPPSVIRTNNTDAPDTPDTTTTDTELDLKRREEMETQREHIALDIQVALGVIPYPTHPKDVLIGRGQWHKDHPGNGYHQALIETNLDRYIATSDNFEKTCISMNVVQAIQDTGGRFLTVVDGEGWKILGNPAARDKTASAFRTKNVARQKAAGKSQGQQLPAIFR